MLGKCWATVYDVGPTFTQHSVNVSCCWDDGQKCILIKNINYTICITSTSNFDGDIVIFQTETVSEYLLHWPIRE